MHVQLIGSILALSNPRVYYSTGALSANAFSGSCTALTSAAVVLDTFFRMRYVFSYAVVENFRIHHGYAYSATLAEIFLAINKTRSRTRTYIARDARQAFQLRQRGNLLNYSIIHLSWWDGAVLLLQPECPSTTRVHKSQHIYS